MKKKLTFLTFGSVIAFSALPFVVVSCANNSNQDAFYLEVLKNELNNFQPSIDKVILDDQYRQKDQQLNLSANNVNMFKITLDDFNIKSTDEQISSQASLDGIFHIKDHEFDFVDKPGEEGKQYPTKKISFNFNYAMIDSEHQTRKPYLDQSKRAITMPVFAALTDLRTGEVVATKYIDFFTLAIIDAKVDNNNDLGFNGLSGKRVYFENKDAKTSFQTLPNEIIDNYLDFQSIPANQFQVPVIYQFDSQKWKNKTFSEVKSISSAISNPRNGVFNQKEYSYSISDSGFDQKEWEFPRFYIEFKPANLSSINQSNATKYGLNFAKKYTYVDYRFKFKKPTESEITTEKSKNDSLASELTKAAETSNIFNPIVNFSRDDVKEFGVDKIVEFFNKSKTQFITPPGFTYTILADDQREIWFELLSARKEEGGDEAAKEGVIAIDIQLNVARDKLRGAATFTKKFDTASWKWV